MSNKKLKNTLENLKEKYKGKSALIFGNGPSISEIDFELIKENHNLITLTTNQIASICRKNNWNPHLYTAFFCEPLKGKKYKKLFRKTINYLGSYEKALLVQKDVQYMVNNQNTECFINDWYDKFLIKNDHSHFVKPILWDRFVDFPKDAFKRFKVPDKFLWNCATTPLFQICFYFNFKKIAIIGQDGYQINAKNHYENYLGNEHLDKTKMVSANKRINKLLDAVHYYSQEYDIKIYNLSKISKFKQFPKNTLENYLENI